MDAPNSWNDLLSSAGDLAVRVSNLPRSGGDYTVPSRYNWMLQYYLRAEGLALSGSEPVV